MSTAMNQATRRQQNLQDRGRRGNRNIDNSVVEKSTAANLLKFAGTWEGEDLEQCLDEVYKTRGETVFR